jgi:hypothetical protein
LKPVPSPLKPVPSPLKNGVYVGDTRLHIIREGDGGDMVGI